MARKETRRSPPRRGGAEQRAPAQQARRKKRRRARLTLHYLLMLVVLLAVGAFLSLTVFFKIESISVVGGDKYAPEDIIAAAGIQEEDNLLRIDTAAAQEAILGEFPYVQSVKIARKFPPKVEIQITQAQPEGAVVDGSTIGLITLEGKLLEKGTLAVPPHLPLIKGISLEGIAPGELLGGEEHPENQERLWMLGYLFEAVDQTDFGPVTNVDLTDRLNMKMVYEARLVLELGSEADMEYKLTFLKEVIADLGPEDQARLDATNVRNKRVLVKWGRVENGEFTPLIGPAESVYEPSEGILPQEEWDEPSEGEGEGDGGAGTGEGDGAAETQGDGAAETQGEAEAGSQAP